MLLWFPKEDGKFDVSAEGIPAKTTIKISYTDGYKKPTRYSDIFELNAVLLFGTTKPKTPVHRIQTGLQNIHQELKNHSAKDAVSPKQTPATRTKNLPQPSTCPDSTTRRVGVLSHSWHRAADPTTKFDENLTTHETNPSTP